MRRRAAVLAASVAFATGIVNAAPPARRPTAPPAPAAGLDPKVLSALRWRHLGPIGNRAIAVAGEPGNPNVAYVGAASGGLFKTIDGGTHWEPVFDDQPASSIGSVAIAPSDPNVVYVGTGETFIRSNISIGNGVYRSTDAGKTWTHVGLDKTGRIGRMVVDPKDPDVAFAAALGHAYGPQPDRGLFKTADGGKTWRKVLFVDEDTGCIDVAMDATNPRVLFAAMWQHVIHTWGQASGGPGSGIFVSKDAGETWKRLSGHGLPETSMGKIAVAVSRSDPRRVYALVETADPGLYRSDDGGESWKLVNQSHDIMERPHYYTRFAVAPDDANRLYFVSVRFNMSLDGGLTLAEEPPRGGGDTHDVWIDPQNPDRMMVGDDGGVNLTVNRGRSWHRAALPIAQIYHVYTDDRIPYNVYGNRQDDSSYKGPAISREGGDIPAGLWHAIGGCECGFAIPDPVDDDVVWSGCYDGGLQRYDDRTRQARDVRVWPEAAYGWPPKDKKYRWQWTFPIAISPHDHETVYVGSQYVHKTTDGGQSWTVISPDLTRNDKSKQESSGGLVVDNLMVEEACVLFAIAESRLEKGLIWAGTKDGLVQVTRDGGGHWTNVTANIPGLPAWGTVSNVEPSRYDAGAAYVTVDRHQSADFDPYVYKTTDYGRTWRSIVSNIPRSVFSYAHVVREDPARKGMLYLGTENGVYVSWNDGGSWTSLQNNLPHAPVYWLTVQERFQDLVAATYGRGFWVLDDIGPLREMDEKGLADPVHLFPPRTAWRFRTTAETQSDPDEQGGGQNVPYGVDVTYFLQEAPKGDVTITIADASGETVRTIDGELHEPSFLRPRNPPKGVNRTTTKEVGVNRVWWDLRYEPTREARLRTKPADHPHTTFKKEGWRPLVTWDLDVWGGLVGPLVPPGTYTVTLRVDGRERSRPLTVEKDPHSAGTRADIGLQVKTSLELRRDINAAVDMINTVEWIRKQVADLASVIESQPKDQDLPKAAAELDAKARAVSSDLYDVHLTGAREDAFRAPMRLYGRLGSLASDVGASSADFPPTNQQLEVKALLEERLAEVRRRFEALVSRDLAAFNALVRDKGVPAIVAPGP